MNPRLTLSACALALAGTASGCAADESPPPPAAAALPDGVLLRTPLTAGESLAVPIEVGPTDAIALQFDLAYDPALLELRESFTAEVPDAPGKDLTVQHLGHGRARVVVFGFGLEPLPAGRLGTVELRARKDADGTVVRAEDCVVADARGRMRANRIVGGTLTIDDEEVKHER